MGEAFDKIFQIKKPIIGMIHLAGKDSAERFRRGLEELAIYEEEGVDGAIIEDYHGTVEDVYGVAIKSSKLNLKIVRGINLLRDPYRSFMIAKDFGAKFVQFDSVQTPDLDLLEYEAERRMSPDIAVLGGVGFKFTKPTGNPLGLDLEEARSRCEAIVTTGEGTGIETPIEKLREYKRVLGNFPLIVGAGINLENVYESLMNCDGAIVGSYFKPNGDTLAPVDRQRVRDLMKTVNALRKVFSAEDPLYKV